MGALVPLLAEKDRRGKVGSDRERERKIERERAERERAKEMGEGRER